MRKNIISMLLISVLGINLMLFSGCASFRNNNDTNINYSKGEVGEYTTKDSQASSKQNTHKEYESKKANEGKKTLMNILGYALGFIIGFAIVAAL